MPRDPRSAPLAPAPADAAPPTDSATRRRGSYDAGPPASTVHAARARRLRAADRPRVHRSRPAPTRRWGRRSRGPRSNHSRRRPRIGDAVRPSNGVAARHANIFAPVRSRRPVCREAPARRKVSGDDLVPAAQIFGIRARKAEPSGSEGSQARGGRRSFRRRKALPKSHLRASGSRRSVESSPTEGAPPRERAALRLHRFTRAQRKAASPSRTARPRAAVSLLADRGRRASARQKVRSPDRTVRARAAVITMATCGRRASARRKAGSPGSDGAPARSGNLSPDRGWRASARRKAGSPDRTVRWRAAVTRRPIADGVTPRGEIRLPGSDSAPARSGNSSPARGRRASAHGKLAPRIGQRASAQR